MKISAIIPTRGARLKEIEIIRKHLHPYFDEITIEHDIGSKVYTRYEAIMRAKNDIIYTQDDDCLVTNSNELINNYEDGIIIANSMRGRRKFYNKISNGRINLIGYGAIFNKGLVLNMKHFQEWLHDSKLFNRECDRVFTFFNKIKLINVEIQNFPSANSGMWTDSDHKNSLYQILYKLNEYEQWNNCINNNFITNIKNIFQHKLSLSKEVRHFYSRANTRVSSLKKVEK